LTPDMIRFHRHQCESWKQASS